MRKVKILHVIGGGEIGGAERHVLNLIRLLDRKKYSPEVLCLCTGPFARLCRDQGITTHEIIMRHKLDLGAVKPIRRLIQDRKIDMVHTHGVRANLVARIAAKKEGLPVVTTFHSMIRYDYQSNSQAMVARIITKLTNSKTDSFITISRAISNDIASMGVPQDIIRVIYNGLDVAGLTDQSSPDLVRQQLGIKPNQRVVATIGRLHPVKGQVYFLEAARLLADQFNDLVFLLVGEGIEREALEQKARSLNLDDKLIMTGFYPKISELYPVMDIFCVPSLMEGMGLVLLESLYFGVPLVATRVGGIPEVITDRVNGLLVPPGDSQAMARAVLSLLNNHDLALSLAASGRERLQDFSMTNMVKQTEEVYMQLLQSRG